MTNHVFRETDAGLSFVGDFGSLYSQEADPWGQSATSGEMGEYYRHSRDVLVRALHRHGQHHILEVGCGHGHLTKQLNENVGPTSGMDISTEALATARRLHPGIEFIRGDITDEAFRSRQWGCVVWAQILWYVLHRIDTALANTLRSIPPGGMFVVSQAFLRSEQKYGKDIADGFYGALAMLSKRDGLQLIESRYDDTNRFVHNDGLMIFRKT